MALIRAVGLFWREDQIFWGAGNQAGRVLGVPTGNRTAEPIDFREQSGIYVLYSGYQLLYVGQTGQNATFLLDRLKQHRKDDLAGRWDRFSWFGLRWVKNTGELSAPTTAAHPAITDVLNHVEGILIHAAEPPLNRQGGRFGDDVERYVQVRDARLGLTDRQLLEQISERINKLT